jgi:glycerol-1-phosphate dehydrogenase [NAD(P)+]
MGVIWVKNIVHLSSEEMTGMNFQCDCGKVHKVDIKKVKIGDDVFSDLISSLAPFRGKKILLVADHNTYEVSGKNVELAICKIFSLETIIFQNRRLVPDEGALEYLRSSVAKGDIAAIVVVGSGTLNDLARYISFTEKIPYFVVCTAPSMDGYASMVSPLIVKGLKKTYPAVYPWGIFADVSIMKDAPMEMLHAGFGDIAGKYTALADWKLANILQGEQYCDTIVQLVRKAVEQCSSVACGLPVRMPEAIHSITEGLVLSGMCIGMLGSSRPASGEEHHLSHTWEMMGLIAERETLLHGNQVGIGTEIILHIYQHLSQLDIQNLYASGKYRQLTREKWIRNIVELFGEHADAIIEEKEQYINFDENSREQHAMTIIGKWEQLKQEVFFSLPSPIEYREMMKSAGISLTPADLCLDRDSFRLSLIVAKDVRQRYGILQLLEDLGILEELADKITNIYY